jgi:hypothetical protein
MKKYNVLLDHDKVERLRDVARRRAVLLGRNVTWVTLLREAADRIIVEDRGRQDVTAGKAVVVGGVR